MLGIKYMSVMVICPTGRANDGSILADKKTTASAYDLYTLADEALPSSVC